MITQSGCFGSTKPTGGTIDDITEVSEVVDQITEQTPAETDPSTAQAAADVAALLGQYANRLRLLTWAVVAIVVVLILREVEK